MCGTTYKEKRTNTIEDVLSYEDFEKHLNDKEDEKNPHLLPLVDVWSVDDYKEIWFFVKDSTRRCNIAYNHLYVAILFNLFNQFDIRPSLRQSFFKTIIIASVGIVETVLFDLMLGKKAYQYDKRKIVPLMERHNKRKQKNIRMHDGVGFIHLLASAEHYGVIDEGLAKEIRAISGFRNKVHIFLLAKREYDVYKGKNAQQIAGLMEKIAASLGLRSLALTGRA